MPLASALFKGELYRENVLLFFCTVQKIIKVCLSHSFRETGMASFFPIQTQQSIWIRIAVIYKTPPPQLIKFEI